MTRTSGLLAVAAAALFTVGCSSICGNCCEEPKCCPAECACKGKSSCKGMDSCKGRKNACCPKKDDCCNY